MGRNGSRLHTFSMEGVSPHVGPRLVKYINGLAKHYGNSIANTALHGAINPIDEVIDEIIQTVRLGPGHCVVWWCHDMGMFSHYWPFVKVNHWSLVDSPHEGPVMKSFNTSLSSGPALGVAGVWLKCVIGLRIYETQGPPSELNSSLLDKMVTI